MKTEYPATIILTSTEIVEPVEALELEQYLNDTVATYVWYKFKLGVRFHIKEPIK